MQIQVAIQTSLNDQWQMDNIGRHKAQFRTSYSTSQALVSKAAMADPSFRTTSVKEVVSRDGSHIAYMLGVFRSKKKKKSKVIPTEDTINDVDPMAFPSIDSKQQSIDTI